MPISFRSVFTVSALAALLPAAFAHGFGEVPKGCSGTATALGIEALLDGSPTLDPVIEGQIIVYRLTLVQPLPSGCNVVGGQLSTTLPDGTVVPLAGFGGPTPDVPVVGFLFPFQIVSPVPYVIDPADAVNGIFTARGDFGGTVNQPGQLNGTFQTDPEQMTASATASLPLPLAAIEINKQPSAFGVCEGDEVLYTYTVTTGPGQASIANVTVVDDTCDQVIFIGGDDSMDDILDPGETWTYVCAATILDDTTNTATASGIEADNMMVMVQAMDTATVFAEPVPQCAIDGPLELTSGQMGVMYSVMETSMPPLDNVTFSWAITGDATFCDGGTTTDGPTACVNTAPDGTGFMLRVTATRTVNGKLDVECSENCNLDVVLMPMAPPLSDCFGDPGCPDCNDNGICDTIEIGDGSADDGNGNGILDECEVSCCDNGQLVVLVMRYTAEACGAAPSPAAELSCTDLGPLPATAWIIANNDPDPDEPAAETWFEGSVDSGGQFEVNALNAGVTRLGSITYIHVFSGRPGTLVPVQTVVIDTSCETDLRVGDPFGGTLLTDCFGDEERLPCDCCFENGRPLLLTMLYTGDTCSASDNNQISADVSCMNFAPLTDTVRILSTPFADPTDENGPIWFEGTIELGDLFTIDSRVGSFDYLLQTSYIHIFSVDEKYETQTLAQTIEFHTSCSQPLFLGDQYGAALLVGCIGEDDPLPPPFDIDCNVNGVEDDLETVLVPEIDGNGNSIPDECEPTCVGDTNGDGTVNVDDIVNVVLDFNTPGFGHNGDMNGDGTVNVDDIVMVVLAQGPCP